MSEWTVLPLIRSTTEYLAGKGIDDPRLNAELLLADALGLKRLDLYLQFDRPVKDAELADFRERVRRRARREPLQYISGEAAFRGLRLRVDRRVLIPRPETEQLVGEVLSWARQRSDLTALDVGTGSGAIALALAAEGPFRSVLATDVSEDALNVARENLAAAQPRADVELLRSDLYQALGDRRFDVIVSNPPYVGEREREALAPEVRDWEPAGALFSGPEGLEALERLIGEAPGHLNRPGLLAVEIGASQGEIARQLARGTGAFEVIDIKRDYSDRDRMLIAERI